MTSKFRKCSVSSTPPAPYENESSSSSSSSDDDPCHVIRGAFLPWWCRNPTISKFAGATNCFPSMRFSDGYSVKNQKYVRKAAASPSRPKTPKADGASVRGETSKAAGERGVSRSVSCSECPSCCNIRPPRPIAGRRRSLEGSTCASASSLGSAGSSASEVNVSRVRRPAARGRREEGPACCALCEHAHQARKQRRAVVGAPARVRRDKSLVSAQRLRFDTTEQIDRLQTAVREEYANRIAIEYLLRLGELQLQRGRADAKASRAMRGYMKMRV